MLGLLGFRGQSMSGQRTGLQGTLIGCILASNGQSGSITAPADCTAIIIPTGSGGYGQNSNGIGGGGGGGAAYKEYALSRGQILTYAAAATQATPDTDGNDSTVTLPTGLIVRGAGGKKAAAAVGGAGGIGSNGDINRSGGDGGAGGTPGTVGQNATPGGGLGGDPVAANRGGGGGGAGFSDMITGITVDNGATTLIGGGVGRVFIFLLRKTS